MRWFVKAVGLNGEETRFLPDQVESYTFEPAEAHVPVRILVRFKSGLYCQFCMTVRDFSDLLNGEI